MRLSDSSRHSVEVASIPLSPSSHKLIASPPDGILLTIKKHSFIQILIIATNTLNLQHQWVPVGITVAPVALDSHHDNKTRAIDR